MNKKIAVKMAAVFFLLSVAMAGCGNKEEVKDEDYTLKIGYGTVLCQAPLQIAIEKGLFEDSVK